MVHDEQHQLSPRLTPAEIHAFQRRRAELGPLINFWLNDKMKPDNLAADGLDFATVADWPNPKREFALSKPVIDPDRLKRLQDHHFEFMAINVFEVRAWPGAGGLPTEWTDQYSIGELAKMLREKSISIPEGAVRLREMLDFADRGSWALDQLRLTLPIVLEEFHSSRDPLPGVPWTPDDGVTRMAVLAYHGDRHVWGLAGFRRTPVRDVKVSDKDMTYMAGTHPDDRRALNEHLGRPKSRRRFIEGTSAAEKSTIALGQLPGLPIRAESTLDATLKRVELRRRHCATASADGLFRPTDNHGRVLANLVALAEFVRTRGAGAFTVDPAHSHSTTQDEAVSAAGTIAQAALSVGGDLSSGYGEAAVLTAYPATIHLVHQLANGAHDADPDPVPAIVNAAPARRALDLANNQRGAAPWLGRQLSRAYLVAADAAQVEEDDAWAKVEYHSVRSLAAVLHHVGTLQPTTDFDDLMMVVRGLNRLGVSHRARWQEGLWRVDQAALCHEAALKLLSWCDRPSGEAWSEYELNCFTTLTNLASAWTEKTHASIDAGLRDVDDSGYLRARTLLMAMRERVSHDTQTWAHSAIHGTGVRACTRDAEQTITCLPQHMIELTLDGDSNYKSWQWILRNDLAEMNWRIGIHSLNARARSNWAPPHKGSPSPTLCLQHGLQLHLKAAEALTSELLRPDRSSEADAVMRFWRWRHLTNLHDKRKQLDREGHGRWLDFGTDSKLDEKLYELGVSYPLEPLDAQQLATLDAYSAADHKVVLWLCPEEYLR